MTPLIISSSSKSSNDHDDTNDVYPWFKTWYVHPVTKLSKSKIMLVHCKSKDIDLGIHNFTWHRIQLEIQSENLRRNDFLVLHGLC